MLYFQQFAKVITYGYMEVLMADITKRALVSHGVFPRLSALQIAEIVSM
jgi:hypothetical protein